MMITAIVIYYQIINKLNIGQVEKFKMPMKFKNKKMKNPNFPIVLYNQLQ